MALKDWKKVSELIWRGKEWDDAIVVELYKKNPDEWIVYMDKDPFNNLMLKDKFKTKSGAVKYAINYMRHHSFKRINGEINLIKN